MELKIKGMRLMEFYTSLFSVNLTRRHMRLEGMAGDLPAVYLNIDY
jgi:hypothetical protein